MADLTKAFTGAGQNNSNDAKKIAIRVQSFNVDKENPLNSTVVGTDLSTNEEVTAYLRADDRPEPNPKYARPEISDLTVKGKKEVRPGGIVQLDGAIFDQEKKAYSGRWLKTLTHDADEGAVFIGQTRVSPMREGGDNSSYKTVDCLSTDIINVEDEASLRSGLIKAFEGAVGNPLAMIRVTDADGEIMSRMFYARNEKTDNGYERLSGEDSLGYIEKNNPKYNGILEALKAEAFNKSDVKVEVVPGSSFRVGSDSCNEGFGKPFIRKSTTSGNEYSTFAHSIVALRKVGEPGNEGMVVISAEPVHYYADFDFNGTGSTEKKERTKKLSSQQASQSASKKEESVGDDDEVDMEAPAANNTASQQAQANDNNAGAMTL